MAKNRNGHSELPGAAAGGADPGVAVNAARPLAPGPAGNAGSIVPAKEAESGQSLR